MSSIKFLSIIVVLVVVFNQVLCQTQVEEPRKSALGGRIRDRIKCGRILTGGVKTCRDTHFTDGIVPSAITDGACCAYSKFSTCVDGLRDELKAQLEKEKCTKSTVSEAIRNYGANVAGSLKTRCDSKNVKDPCQKAKSKKGQ